MVGGGDTEWVAVGQLAAAPGQCAHAAAPQDQRSLYSYDERNRPKTLNHPNGTADLSFEYEADGLLKAVSVIEGGIVQNRWDYAYNKRRLLEHETLSVIGRSYAIDHNYDAYGSRSQLIYPDGTSLSLAPNRLGQPKAVGTLASGARYWPSGAVRAFSYANGVTYDSSLNTRQLPGQVQISHGILDESYGWDQAGNLLSVTDHRSAATSRTRAFEYDPANRLTSAIYAAPNLGPYGYQYDIHDNLIEATRPAALGGDRNYQYHPTTRRLMRLHTDGDLTQIGYDYDANGNATLRDASGLGLDAYGYVYDRANRLLTVRDAVDETDVKARYQYDGHARRVLIEEAGEPRVQVYSHGGQYLFEEPDLISDASFSTGASAQSKPSTRYQYLGNMLVAKSSGNQTTFLHTDHLGSPIAESTAAPVQVTHLPLHEPYGAPTDGNYLDGPGYTGHVVDGLTGLSYMQARYYDPIAGRFLGVDPVHVDLGTGRGFNRFAYAANSPLAFVDLDGRREDYIVEIQYRVSNIQQTRAVDDIVASSSGEMLLDVTPGVGDAKGVYDAYNDPTPISIGAAVIGVVPLVGDIGAQALKGAEKLADFRAGLDLPAAGSASDQSTLALVEINGSEVYGINAHGQQVGGVNAISATHAEVDALNQIKQQGIDVRGQELTMFVDRDPCRACGPNGGIRSMMRQLGVTQLTVHSPSGMSVIKE